MSSSLHPAERHDVVALGDRHARRAREHERARATGFAVRDPIGDELIDRLSLAHLSQIQDERPVRRVVLTERLGVVPWRRVETDPEHLARDVLVAEPRVDEVALLGREEPERARQLEQRAVRDEAERLLVVRGRDERGALGHDRQSRRGRLVDVRVEEDRVVALALAAQELEEVGRVRSLHREPRLLVGERVWLEEDVPLGFLEVRAAHAGDREAPHAHRTVHRLRRPGNAAPSSSSRARSSSRPRPR